MPLIDRIARAFGYHKRSYQDAIVEAIVNSSTDSASGISGAAEIAAGMVGRCFASCKVEGTSAALFPSDVLNQVGRDLILSGDSVWRISAGRLDKVTAYEVHKVPNGWAYRIENQAVSNILHVRYSTDWNSGYGVGPLQSAQQLNLFAKELERSYARESRSSSGYLLPVPRDGMDASVDDLKDDLRDNKGRLMLVESVASGWGDGRAAAPHGDWVQRRYGPAFPESNSLAFTAAVEQVGLACGIPVELLRSGPGNASREAWRRLQHGTIEPLGRLLTAAAAAAGLSISLDWGNLFASDLAGRARAFQGLVAGGLELDEAAELTGLLAE